MDDRAIDAIATVITFAICAPLSVLMSYLSSLWMGVDFHAVWPFNLLLFTAGMFAMDRMGYFAREDRS